MTCGVDCQKIVPVNSDRHLECEHYVSIGAVRKPGIGAQGAIRESAYGKLKGGCRVVCGLLSESNFMITENTLLYPFAYSLRK
jgi:hypothetical protein